MSKELETENFLREQYKDEVMVYFRYFVGCYFIPDYDYDELPSIIKEYMKNEIASMSEGLLRELTLLKERGDWYYVQTFVSKHGLRKLTIKKLQAMFDLMINELTLENEIYNYDVR